MDKDTKIICLLACLNAVGVGLLLSGLCYVLLYWKFNIAATICLIAGSLVITYGFIIWNLKETKSKEEEA